MQAAGGSNTSPDDGSGMGGAGGAGDQAAGDDGEGYPTKINGGGGAGAAGRIRINHSGSVVAEGIISPTGINNGFSEGPPPILNTQVVPPPMGKEEAQLSGCRAGRTPAGPVALWALMLLCAGLCGFLAARRRR